MAFALALTTAFARLRRPARQDGDADYPRRHRFLPHGSEGLRYRLGVASRAVAAIFGAGLTAVVIALVVATVPDVARVARGAAIGIMSQEFMEAGRAVGVADRTLIWRYLTLNCISTIFVFLTLRFGQIILIGSALGFLGMGAQPPAPEWGTMLAEAREFILRAWWVVTFPGLAILITVLAINLMGDGLRDALDPKLKRS